MKLTPDEFRAHCRRYKTARGAIVEAYIAEHPQEEYHFEDLDSVYQLQVAEIISRPEVHSARGHHNAICPGGTRTMSGQKYGYKYD